MTSAMARCGKAGIATQCRLHLGNCCPPLTAYRRAWIIPGQDHNGHNGANRRAKVQAWNEWLQGNIQQYVNYALTPANKTLLIITQDEKSGAYCGDKNHIMLFLISADLTPTTDGKQVGDADGPTAAQYNILRTITQNFGLPNLGNANATVAALIPPL